jgi:small subunit ribosomal protein S6
MRRYELMLVLRPDTADDRVQQILDRTTRGIAEADGQIVKVSPWGRRRLAYPINGQREGSYFIVVFESPSEAVEQLEHSLNITEELLRHLITRVERPVSTRRPGSKGDGAAAEESVEAEEAFIDGEFDEEDVGVEVIDESESEAAPRATD